MRVIVVTTDNEVYIKEIKQPYHKDMQEIVDGYIKVVHPQGLDKGLVMIVNEEGIIYHLPLNLFGCLLYRTHEHGAPIVGNIIISKEAETPDGLDFTDFDNDELDYVYNQITELDFINEKEIDHNGN